MVIRGFSLEDDFGSELEFSWCGALGCGEAGGGGAYGCAGGSGENYVVDVEGLGAEFEAYVFVDWGDFDQGEVEVVEVGLAEIHLAHVAVRGDGDGEDGGVEETGSGGSAERRLSASAGCPEGDCR